MLWAVRRLKIGNTSKVPQLHIPFQFSQFSFLSFLIEMRLKSKAGGSYLLPVKEVNGRALMTRTHKALDSDSTKPPPLWNTK